MPWKTAGLRARQMDHFRQALDDRLLRLQPTNGNVLIVGKAHSANPLLTILTNVVDVGSTWLWTEAVYWAEKIERDGVSFRFRSSWGQ